MRTLLRIEEVAVLCGVSVQTINNWYKFKATYPDNDYAKMLPEIIRVGNRNQKFWDKADIQRFINFKRAIPKGRKGVMGDITQRYVR